ncbi:MAG: peptidoglycan-binding protein [Candidatus Pacebacteria bacterium]|nr:peptidoglycan-binding protein [Candidatus Paceibacterota bacterium]
MKKTLMVAAFVLGTLPIAAFADTLTRQLDVGSTGNDVSSLQTFLAEDVSLYPQGLVTGYFGSLTQRAVSNFQSRNNIPAVGRVGPITLVALNAQMGGNTIGSNRTAPVISNLGISVSRNTALLNWATNKGAAGIVYYNTSPLNMIEASANTPVTISGSALTVSTSLQTSFSAGLVNLQPNTIYYYVVYVRDGMGNESVTSQSTFHTLN